MVILARRHQPRIYDISVGVTYGTQTAPLNGADNAVLLLTLLVVYLH